MVIVAIVLIVAALAAPGMMRGMAASRAQRVTGHIERLIMRARMESMTYGRAIVLVYMPLGRGRLEVWRGVNDSCNLNPWPRIISAGACGPGQPDCIDAVDVTEWASAQHYPQINPSMPGRICFEPSGRMLVDGGSGRFIEPTTHVLLTVDRYDAGISTTTPIEQRSVIIPIEGAPRIQR
jgi:hypothetical protein